MITAIHAPDAAMPGGTGAYVLAPNVRLLVLQDGTARLLDLAGTFYALSTTGTALLCAVLQHALPTAVHHVATTYAVDAQHVQQDMRPFLAALEHRQLIVPASTPPPAIIREAQWPAVVLRAVLRRGTTSTAGSPRRVRLLLTLAYMSMRVWGVARTLTIWQRTVPRPPQTVADVAPVARDIDAAVRTVAARHLLPITCKERALCCWTLLRALGLPAQLVLGIALFPLASHCWCELDTGVLTDDEDTCRRFTPVWRYA